MVVVVVVVVGGSSSSISSGSGSGSGSRSSSSSSSSSRSRRSSSSSGSGSSSSSSSSNLSGICSSRLSSQKSSVVPHSTSKVAGRTPRRPHVLGHVFCSGGAWRGRRLARGRCTWFGRWLGWQLQKTLALKTSLRSVLARSTPVT